MKKIFIGIGLLALSWAAAAQPRPVATGPVPDRAPYFAPNENSEYFNTVQQGAFRYFRDFAHPVSGMAPERTATPNVVTTGGTGFGVLGLVAGAYRGWITREQAAGQLLKISRFLQKAERFHGAWSHWLDGTTGRAVPFSPYDDGGDLVETAFLMNGLLASAQYFNRNTPQETQLRQLIDRLYREVEWDWYVHEGRLLWHWSPRHGWKMNHGIGGFNECLITYVLALGSPTHPITPEVYVRTWKQLEPSHYRNGRTFLGYRLPLGFDYGGPLFFSHYSFLTTDPRTMQDEDANYWQLNLAHTLINRAYCLEKAPEKFGYSEENWGLTASDDHQFYGAHRPGDDNGTISPTAAMSAFPYTPWYSMQALKHLYRREGNRLFGPYGFYDAYNKLAGWYSNQYLAIDQGPMVVMMENYRSGLLWQLGSRVSYLQKGLDKMGIRVPDYPVGFYAYLPEARTGRVDLLKQVDEDRYVLDFATRGTEPVSLTLQPASGGASITILSNKSLPGGTHRAFFEAAPGDYRAELRQGATTVTQAISLH